MTQWIDNPDGGRDRGPRAVARAWLEVLVAPRRFFRAAVAPADQAPGLFFLIAVVLLEEGSRYLLVPGAAPRIGGRPIAGPILGLAVTALFLAPLVLHLLVAVQTALLALIVPDRAGISETVQVMAYATAPCVLVGIPSPTIRLACTAYGAVLLAVGLAVAHDAPYRRIVPAAVVPAALGFRYGFRGFAAGQALAHALAGSISSIVGVLAYF